MVEVDTSAAKIKGKIFSQNPNPNFVMDQFLPSSSRKPRLNKHRKAPNRKESNYLSQKSVGSAERKNSSWNPFVPGSGNSAFVFEKNEGLSGECSNFDASRNFNNNSFDSNSNVNSLSRDSSLGSEEGLVFTEISDVMKRTGLKEKKCGNFDSGLFNELPNEMKKMNLKSSYGDDFAKSKEGGSSSKPINVASGISDKQPVFVFKSKTECIDSPSRSSAIGTDDLISQLCDEPSQRNLKNNASVSDFKENKQTKNAFVFEGYMNSSTSIKTEPASFGSEIRRNSDPFVFVFGSGVNNSANSSRNSSVDPPDEPKKINLKNTSNEGDAEKPKPSDDIFVFGDSLNSSKPANAASEKSTARSASFRSERSDISNAGVFVFGSGVNSSTNLSRNSSLGSVESFFSEIPDDIGKVKISGNIDDFERKKQPQNHFASGSNTSSLNTESAFIPGAIPIPNGKTGGKSYSTNFVFGSGMKKNAGFGENSSLGSDEGLSSKLPDDNIGKSKSIENIFLFGSTEFTTGIGANRVPKETAKFSVGINTSTQSMKNASLGSSRGKFEFAAKKDKEMNQNVNNGDSNGFVFGATSSFNPLNGSMENLNTGTNVENPTDGFANKFDVGTIPSSPMFSPVDKPPIMDFKVPLTKETLFTGTCHNKPFTAKKSDAKNTKTKKKKDKTRQSVPIYQKNPVQFASERSDSPVNIDVYSNGDCSPMDCSPYHDNVVSDQYSRETSVASEDMEYMVLEAQRLNISVDSTSRNEQLKEENMGYDNESRTSMGGPNSEAIGVFNFNFTSTPSTQGPVPAVKPNFRRKDRLKACHHSSSSISSARVPFSSSPLPDLIPRTDTSLFNPVGANCNVSAESLDDSKEGDSQEFEAREKSPSLNNNSVAEQALCEKWRFRGNQAYSNGHLSKAEDYYTCGVNSISLKEIPSGCIRPLTLCYSNRAVTRMSLGKIREALSDSKMAVSIDPAFLKAQVRVASCHLALGEIGEALKHFKKCLQSEKSNRSDQKYLNEATDGLEKAQKVADLTGQSAELLLRRTSIDASKALSMTCEALSFSPHSESLLEMKAEALLMMRNYTEVIKLCEETLDLAERNSDSPSENFSSPAKLWRSRMIAKSYFYLGKLEAALELLQQHEKASKSSSMFVSTIQELLRLKSAGNEAFQAARHSEAVEYYTSALMCNAESRPFTAVCFCNRAAAYQALGQISDAIADCSLAIALDSSYAKAISRRATLHEMIRDYDQATNDLNRLISLLQKQIKDLDNESRRAGKSSSLLTELKRAQSRLVTVEEEGRKEISLNMYMILGIEVSSSAADIKKAYRKAALRHHPDKAGQSLVRNENVDDESWREVVAEVHADADRLFKMIGEAYATLSDPSKRLKYDEEEEMRTSSFRSYNVGSPRYSADAYSNYYHENNLRRQSQAHGNAYRRW